MSDRARRSPSSLFIVDNSDEDWQVSITGGSRWVSFLTYTEWNHYG
jgi:hypothetical protein